MSSLKGKKHALVTGRSRGIGRGIVLKLAQQGAKVAIHYFQNLGAAEATLAKIRELGSDGFLVQADVCKPEEIQRMFARVKSEFGALDIFVSNARTEASTSTSPQCRSRSTGGTPPWTRRPRRSWSGCEKQRH